MADDTGTGRGRRRRFGGSLWLVALVVCAAVVVTVVVVLPHRSTRPVVPGGPLVSASVPFFNLDHGTDAVVNNQRTVNEVSPWMYGVGEHGEITHQYPPDRAGDVDRNIQRLRGAGVPIVPSLANITDGRWTYQPVSHVLADTALRHGHVNEIVGMVERQHYAGIDIDYENLRATDRDNFTAFVTELGQRLHEKHKTLSVALFAKDSDAGTDERNRAQDYAAIGRSADQVRLMGYDYHWATSPPGPVAPIGWIRSVLDYARSKIPPARIVLGVTTAGYDWSNGHGRAVSWLEAFRLSRDYHAPAQYDQISQSPWFRYTDPSGAVHEVWFENATSSQAKFDAARGAGIRGVYLWMFGYEDTKVWQELDQTFRPVR